MAVLLSITRLTVSIPGIPGIVKEANDFKFRV